MIRRYTSTDITDTLQSRKQQNYCHHWTAADVLLLCVELLVLTPFVRLVTALVVDHNE